MASGWPMSIPIITPTTSARRGWRQTARRCAAGWFPKAGAPAAPPGCRQSARDHDADECRQYDIPDAPGWQARVIPAGNDVTRSRTKRYRQPDGGRGSDSLAYCDATPCHKRYRHRAPADAEQRRPHRSPCRPGTRQLGPATCGTPSPPGYQNRIAPRSRT